MVDVYVFLMENYSGNDFFNVGTGKEITIKELAERIKEVVGYKGELKFNAEKPDGITRKLLDVSKLTAAGWKYKIELKSGIEKSYQWFKENYKFKS